MTDARTLLRAPRPEELPALEAMVLALYAEDSPGEPMDAGKIRRTLRTLEAHPDKGRVRLIEVDGACIGYLILIDFWSNEYGGDLLTLDELYLRPEWRGRGFGRAVIEHLVATLPQAAVGLQLEVSPQNPRAASFYRRLGFRPMRNRPLVRLR